MSDRQLFAIQKRGEEADHMLTIREEWDLQLDAALKGYVAGMDRQNTLFAKKRS